VEFIERIDGVLEDVVEQQRNLGTQLHRSDEQVCEQQPVTTWVLFTPLQYTSIIVIFSFILEVVIRNFHIHR